MEVKDTNFGTRKTGVWTVLPMKFKVFKYKLSIEICTHWQQYQLHSVPLQIIPELDAMATVICVAHVSTVCAPHGWLCRGAGRPPGTGCWCLWPSLLGSWVSQDLMTWSQSSRWTLNWFWWPCLRARSAAALRIIGTSRFQKCALVWMFGGFRQGISMEFGLGSDLEGSACLSFVHTRLRGLYHISKRAFWFLLFL